MTTTTLAAPVKQVSLSVAEALLKDVPRMVLHSTSGTPIDVLPLDRVLAALTAAMDPALSERAGEVIKECLQAVENGEGPYRHDWRDKPHKVVYALTRQIIAQTAQNAALRAEVRKSAMDAVSAGCQAQEAYEAQKAAEAERDALRAEADRYLRHLTAGAESLNAYKARAEAAEAVAEKLRAERDAEIAVCGGHRSGKNHAYRVGVTLGKASAEAQIAALTARVEGLTGALRKAEQDFYEAANRFQDEDYEGPHEKFTVNVVCHIKPYFDMHIKHLRNSAAAARAALKGDDQ